MTDRKYIQLHNNWEPAVGTIDELCLLMLDLKNPFNLLQCQEKINKSYFPNYLSIAGHLFVEVVKDLRC